MTPFVGQIQPLGFGFNPRGWAKCDGQLLQVSQNDALFSLLGTIYGGDGRTTFGLPDLRGRTMIHEGQGPGLSNRPIGSKGGTITNTLVAANMPSHHHAVDLPVSSEVQSTTNANQGYLTAHSDDFYAAAATTGQQYGSTFNTGSSGNNTALNNLQPYLVINVCIALVGVYPSRT